MRLLTLLALCMPFCSVGQTAMPVFSKPAGFYTDLASVALSVSAAYDIRYTTNGDSVSASSPLYQSPFSFNRTTVLRARCYWPNQSIAAGPIVTNTYFKSERVYLPVLSITMAPYHLWDQEVGIYVEGDQIDTCNFYPFPCANYWQGWEKPAFAEYFDENQDRIVAQNIGIEITGGWSKANPKKGLLVQFDHDEYGDGKVKDWPLMPDKPNVTSWKNLHVRPGGNGLNSQFAHDAWLQKSMRNTHNDYIAYQPAHVFLNGEYWGVYELRERQDKHYIKYNYGVDDDSVDVIRFPESSNFYGNTNYYAVQAGSDSLWKRTIQRLQITDPATPGFYALIDSEFDLDNYIDYFAVQTFIGNNDWIGPWYNNIRVWRPQTPDGKWRYMLWDLDGSLGEQWDNRYTSCFDNIQYARHPDFWSNEHSWMFDKMCMNPQFQERFARRYSVLLNTVLTPQHLSAVGNEILVELDADIDRNFKRWGGDKSFWQRRFSENIQWARQRRICIAGNVAKALLLEGAVFVSVAIYPPEAGYASVDTLGDIETPWNGVFFKDFGLSIQVKPKEDWIFSHWGSDGAPLLSPDSMQIDQRFTQNTSLTAYFIPKLKEPGSTNGAIVYPNPATDLVFVQAEKALGPCTLFDVSGRIIGNFQTQNTFASINVKGLPSGLYFLRSNDWVQKISIQ